MPYAIFDYTWAPFCAIVFAHVDNVIPVIKTITWLLLSSLQLNKRHRNSPEPSDPCLRNLSTRAGTLQNPPEPSETFRNQPSGTYLLNLRQHTPEPSEIFRNLPPEPTPFYTGTLRNLPELASGTYTTLHRNSPEPSGTRLRNLHQHTPELSGTFRNLPEPSSGTCSCGPHRHTPELIWAEDPISLRCWGIRLAEDWMIYDDFHIHAAVHE